MRRHVTIYLLRALGLILSINSLLLVSCGNWLDKTESPVPVSGAQVAVPPLSPGFADSAFHRAEFFRGSNQPDSALRWHHEALNARLRMPADEQLARSYFAVGSSYLDDLKYHVAERYLDRARIIGDSIGIDPALLTEIYFKLSDCKRNLKDFPLAISLLEHATDIVREQLPGRRDLFARCHLLISGTYYMGRDYKASVAHALNAIALTPASDHQNLSTYHTMLGMAYHDSGDEEMALRSLDEAVRHDLIWAGPDSDALAIRYVQKAAVLRALGRYDEAYVHLRRNLLIREKIYGAKHVNTFGAKYSIGQFYLDTQQFDSAAQYYHESLAALLKDFSEPDVLRNPAPTAHEIGTDLVLGLVGKASALHKASERDSGNIAMLVKAIETYSLADSVFAVYRRNFATDGAQLQQVGSGYIPYPAMMDASFRLFQHSGNARHAEHALRIAENSRAVVLQDALIRAESYGKAGLPEDLRVRENHLMSRRQGILQQLSRHQPERVMDSLQRQLVIVNDSHQMLLQQVARINPQYLSFRYDDEPLSLTALKDRLREENAVLFEYLWSSDKIYLITVSAEGFRTRTIPVDSIFREAFRGAADELRAPFNTIYDRSRFQEFCRHSHYLYRQLIAPDADILRALEDGGRMVISADGPLESFPFEILIRDMPSSPEVDYHLRYVFLDHHLSYTFSSRMLLKPRARSAAGNVLGFAYTGRPSSTGMTALPGTERELSRISAIVGRKNNMFLLGEAASEANFKKEVGNFGIVHLALHGLGDTLNPLESRLVFRGENDTIDDGSLYAHELYDINLRNLDLAVLSACESGIGKHQSGEGVMSIARSFAYGGCPSQVISLWKIDDAASSRMMAAFYQHLAEGREVDRALALAKADYLATANEFGAHPAFWAAFIHVGEDAPVFNNNKRWKFLIIASGIIIGTLLIFRWRRGFARRSG